MGGESTGMQIDKYEIIKNVNEGGFGSVMLAKDIRINRLVAIKKMPPGENTYKEMELLKRLKHSGIPQVYDYITNEKECYIVMEYIEGVSLKEYLYKYGKVSFDKFIKWINQLMDIFEYLHSLKPGIIYRDLKPENVMIADDGDLKLIDLGSALIRSYSGTNDKSAYGTKGYSAPELWRGEIATPSSDIYSFGALIYEMLTGCKAASFIVNGNAKEAGTPMSKGLEMIILKCLSNDKEMRYQNIKELREDINHYKSCGRLMDIWFNIKKLLVIIGYIMAIAYVLSCVDRYSLSLLEPMGLAKIVLALSLAILFHMIMIYKDISVNRRTKIEKEIWLTQKKYVGLYLLFGMVLGYVLTTYVEAIAPGKAYASNATHKIWVEMKDDKERKMLLSEEGIYEVKDKVRLEIPSSSIPDTKMKIKVLATDSEGNVYSSREFGIDNSVVGGIKNSIE